VDIPIKRFDKQFPLPEPTKGAACFDFICRETVTIPAHQIKAIPQNVAVKIPAGYALLVFIRSSTPLRKGLMLANGVGVVDPFYCGEKDENPAFFLNITDNPVTVEAGDKIVQGMVVKVEPVTWHEVDIMKDPGHGGYQYLNELK